MFDFDPFVVFLIYGLGMFCFPFYTPHIFLSHTPYVLFVSFLGMCFIHYIPIVAPLCSLQTPPTIYYSYTYICFIFHFGLFFILFCKHLSLDFHLIFFLTPHFLTLNFCFHNIKKHTL